MSPAQDLEMDRPASHAILLAEALFFLGMFKVPMGQIKPHRGQRPIDLDWVTKLHAKFLEVGVGRAEHPIKILLEPGVEATLTTTTLAHIRTLPLQVSGLVFQGQHRVAACKLLDDPQEHWWYAEVYMSGLETSHPAEFLTSMHCSNEEDFRLETTDPDRFLAMHKLLQMKHDGVIDEETYSISQQRLEGSLKDGTRQGLRNLLRSRELADAVAQALEHEHLRPGFNAGTWGKKLVKGRFYAVAVGLIKEMIEQSQLLKGSWNDVPSKPFRLGALHCTWKQLGSGVRRKDHAWQGLEGGAKAAFERVKSRSPEFVHLMNPLGSDSWMLESTALLPSVLTSEMVTSRLADMYKITQHMIHMTAGHTILARYTSARADESETDHPFGIITIVLKDQLQGKVSNYPNKILYHIWRHRAELLRGLEQQKIGDAVQTTRQEYQRLILEERSWWALTSLFKMRVLSKGLNLEVPKAFSDANQSSTAESHASTTTAGGRGAVLIPGLPPCSPARTHTWAKPDGQNTAQGSDTYPEPNEPGHTTSELGSAHGVPAHGQHQLIPEYKRAQSSTTGSSNNPFPTPPQRKRRMVDYAGADTHVQLPHGEDSDWDFIDEPELRTDIPLAGVSSAFGLRSYSRLVGQMEGLRDSVPQLQLDETQALGDLLGQLIELQGTGCLPRVTHALNARIQPLAKRARKANQAAQWFDADENDGEPVRS